MSLGVPWSVTIVFPSGRNNRILPRRRSSTRQPCSTARRTSKGGKAAESYRHDEEALLRPDVGTQAQFKKKPPKTYRYDSSLSPALDWDGQNPARELGEWLIERIDAASRLEPPHLFAGPRRFGEVEIAGLQDAVARLKALSGPFLDWAGKAERLSFDVPTLPLFVHERLSTKAILETLSGHERDRQMELQLFADPQLPLHQQLDARGPGFDDFCAARKALIAAALNDMLRLSVDALTEEPLAADDVPEPEIGAWAEDAGGIPGV